MLRIMLERALAQTTIVWLAGSVCQYHRAVKSNRIEIKKIIEIDEQVVCAQIVLYFQHISLNLRRLIRSRRDTLVEMLRLRLLGEKDFCRSCRTFTFSQLACSLPNLCSTWSGLCSIRRTSVAVAFVVYNKNVRLFPLYPKTRSQQC